MHACGTGSPPRGPAARPRTRASTDPKVSGAAPQLALSRRPLRTVLPQSPERRRGEPLALRPARVPGSGPPMPFRSQLPVWRAAVIAVLLTSAGARAAPDGAPKHEAPIPAATLALMRAKDTSAAAPILIRAYKKEAEMEVWKKARSGRFVLLKTFPICRWSGQLGPKRKEGDRQAPEGFYPITPGQMNPNSSYYLSFDIGYPNAFDRAQGGTGAHLMVHGTCSSSGCFAMTDESIAEIYAIAREAFAGGQRGFQFQSYPFRMTAENLAKHRVDPNMAFWRNLKEGSDHFEALKEEPKVTVCGRRYVFGGSDVAQGSCSPKLDPAVAEKREADESQVAALIAKGAPAVRTVYADGAQHQSFRETQVADGGDAGRNFSLFARPQPRRNLGEGSR